MGGPWEGTRAEGAQETINQRLHCPSPPGTCGVLTLTTGHLWGSDLSPLGTYRVLTLTTGHLWGADLSPLGTYRALILTTRHLWGADPHHWAPTGC